MLHVGNDKTSMEHVVVPGSKESFRNYEVVPRKGAKVTRLPSAKE